jgi:hypothetical protein
MIKYEGKIDHILPQCFKTSWKRFDAFKLLEKLLVVPEKDDVKYAKNYNKIWECPVCGILLVHIL